VDNLSTNGQPVDNLGMTWGPRRAVIAATGVLAIAGAVGATLYGREGDRIGALLLWLVALLFVALTAYASLLNPRLFANQYGVAVRTLKGTREVDWQYVEVRVKTTRRLGRDTRTLELELASQDGGAADSELVVLGQFELGAEPDDVLEDLNRLRG